MLGSAAGGLLRLTPEFYRVASPAHSANALHRSYAIKRLSVSFLGRLFLAVAAVILLAQGQQPVAVENGFFFAASVVLLVNATRNAWFLLVHELPGHV